MDYSFVLQPQAHTAFGDEAEQLAQCREWGLLSEKAVKMKGFYYKRGGASVACAIVGYVDTTTAVIELDNGQLHCIHPSYLKEMQAASYGVKPLASDSAEAPGEPVADAPASVEAPASAITPASADAPASAIASASADAPASADASASADAPAQTDTAASAATSSAEPAVAAKADAPTAAAKKAKSKKEKLQLPEEKVSMTATVQSFATVPNHFSDTDDEVVVYESVSITEPAIELGAAWSSHSATLKKLELEVGDTIAFEAKVAAKKLTKHPVPYKINNPSKLRKL